MRIESKGTMEYQSLPQFVRKPARTAGWGLGYIMHSVYCIVLDKDTVLECARSGSGSVTHRAAYRHSFPRLNPGDGVCGARSAGRFGARGCTQGVRKHKS